MNSKPSSNNYYQPGHRFDYNDQQRQLAEFQADPIDLTREIAVCRYLLQYAVDTGNCTLANNLLLTIGTLSKEQEQISRHEADKKTLAELVALAQEIVEAIARHFSDCDRFDERIDALENNLENARLTE